LRVAGCGLRVAGCWGADSVVGRARARTGGAADWLVRSKKGRPARHERRFTNGPGVRTDRVRWAKRERLCRAKSKEKSACVLCHVSLHPIGDGGNKNKKPRAQPPQKRGPAMGLEPTWI
jgi:hypothetical protein